MQLLKVSLLLFCVVVGSFAHSWIECTDYRGNPDTYEQDKCMGYARGFPDRKAGKGFGVEAQGFEYRGALQKSCQYDRPSSLNDLKSLYTSNFPMATYVPGQTYCLAWPAKNHAAYSACTGKYIPDNQNKIYISSVNPTRDPTRDEFKNSLLHDIGTNPFGTTEHKGFQNCTRNFCQNTDKALCQGCFVMPNKPSGIYTLQWFWEFNPGEFYATCFEVEVKSGGGNPNPSPNPSPSPLPSPSAPAPPPPGNGVPSTPANFRLNRNGNVVDFMFTTVPGSATQHYIQVTNAQGQLAYGKFTLSAIACVGAECAVPIALGNNPPSGTYTVYVIGFNADSNRYGSWSSPLRLTL